MSIELVANPLAGDLSNDLPEALEESQSQADLLPFLPFQVKEAQSLRHRLTHHRIHRHTRRHPPRLHRPPRVWEASE